MQQPGTSREPGPEQSADAWAEEQSQRDQDDARGGGIDEPGDASADAPFRAMPGFGGPARDESPIEANEADVAEQDAELPDDDAYPRE